MLDDKLKSSTHKKKSLLHDYENSTITKKDLQYFLTEIQKVIIDTKVKVENKLHTLHFTIFALGIMCLSIFSYFVVRTI